MTLFALFARSLLSHHLKLTFNTPLPQVTTLEAVAAASRSSQKTVTLGPGHIHPIAQSQALIPYVASGADPNAANATNGQTATAVLSPDTHAAVHCVPG
jgi:hypothetical protein